MNDTAEAEVYDLTPPDYSSRARSSRKTTYRARQTNTVTLPKAAVDLPFEVDDAVSEVASYVRFDSARLIGCKYREQRTNDKPDGTPGREMLVVSAGIILDGLEVGLIDPDGREVPHPLLSEPRFANYRQFPHRVNAQQWMAREHVDGFDALANYLYDNHEFRIITNPRNPEDSQRTTTDKVRVRPINSIDELNDPSDYGAPCDGFEVSVNENYPDGFRSFYQGLTEQQKRIESAFNEDDPELRAEAVKSLEDSGNIHMVGGAYFDKNQQRWYARVVDVGVVYVDNRQFPFYPVRGEKLDSSKLLNESTADSGNGQGSKPLQLTGPTAEQIADF